MILSLASLTLSLFPHTLICGSAMIEKRERDIKRARVTVSDQYVCDPMGHHRSSAEIKWKRRTS